MKRIYRTKCFQLSFKQSQWRCCSDASRKTGTRPLCLSTIFV